MLGCLGKTATQSTTLRPPVAWAGKTPSPGCLGTWDVLENSPCLVAWTRAVWNETFTWLPRSLDASLGNPPKSVPGTPTFLAGQEASLILLIFLLCLSLAWTSLTSLVSVCISTSLLHSIYLSQPLVAFYFSTTRRCLSALPASPLVTLSLTAACPNPPTLISLAPHDCLSSHPLASRNPLVKRCLCEARYHSAL